MSEPNLIPVIARFKLDQTDLNTFRNMIDRSEKDDMGEWLSDHIRHLCAMERRVHKVVG